MFGRAVDTCFVLGIRVGQISQKLEGLHWGYSILVLSWFCGRNSKIHTCTHFEGLYSGSLLLLLNTKCTFNKLACLIIGNT